MSSVSFIIPVFNKQNYLKFVINSLKKQSGRFDREFIFIDDGSTDNSLKILKSETKNLENTTIHAQKNKGSANATNCGIQIAKKKYIKFLDADDLLVSSTTEVLLNIIEKNKKCNLVFGNQRKVKNLSIEKLNNKLDEKKIKIIKDPLKNAMKNSMFNPSQFLVRTDLCKKSGGCDERIKFSQEYSLTLRLAVYGGFFHLDDYVAILPEVAPGQISEKKINQIYRVSKALEYFIIDKKDLSDDYIKFAQRRLTGRAWRFSKKHCSDFFFSKWFKLYIRGFLGIKNNLYDTCKKANSIYENHLD